MIFVIFIYRLDNTHKKEEELCISNHESGGSNCSSLLSTTLNDSQGSVSGDASSSAKSTSPSDTTDLSRDNFQRNDHSTNNINNETLSRDMFENDTDMAEKNTSSPNDSSLSSGEEDDDDLLIRMPKKSCLKKFLQELNDEYSLIDSTADATSSPLGKLLYAFIAFKQTYAPKKPKGLSLGLDILQISCKFRIR